MAKGDQIKILLGYLEQKDYPKALAYVKKHPKVFRTALKAMTEEIIPLWGNFANATQKGEPKTAEAIYRRIIEIYPQDALAHYNLGSLLHNQGKLDETEQEYRAAIKADPKNSAAHNNLGLLLKNKGKQKEAEQEYREAIKADPNYSTAHYNLGLLLSDKGKLKEAENAYRKAIEINPNHSTVHNNLGILLEDKGELEEAEDEYRKAIKADPNNSAAHYNLALLLKDKSKLKEAEKEYREAIEIDPKLFQAHNNLGILLDNKGDLKGAEKHYRKAIEADPKYSIAHYNLGLLLHNQKKLKDAEKEYRAAIKANPKYTSAHLSLGVLLHNQEKLKGAEKKYRKVIELDPENPAAYNNLGILLKNKGKLKEAEKEYRKAIEINPHYSAAHYNLGNLLREKGGLEGAEKEFNKALEFTETLSLNEQKVVATNLAGLLLDMGYLACQLGDFEDFSNKAERLFTLLKEHPVRPDKKNELYSNAYFLSGILDLQADQYEKAIEHFRKAARLNTKDARIYHNLAVAYCSAKKFKQASQSIQATIDIKKKTGEEDEQAKKLQKKIDKALNPIRIRWWRYIPFTCTFIFWLIPAIWGKCLFPQSKDGILSLMMVLTFLASAVFLLAPVLPYVKKIGIAKIGDIEIDVEAPGKWDYSSLTEMRQTIPAKALDTKQASKPTKSE